MTARLPVMGLGVVDCEVPGLIVYSSISGFLTPLCYGDKERRAWVEDVSPWRQAFEEDAWPPSLPPPLCSLVVMR